MSTRHVESEAVTEGMTIAEVGALLWRRRRDVLLIAGGVLTLVVVVTLLSPLKFRVKSSLYLGELQSGSAPAAVPNELDFLGVRNGDVGTEIEILKSRSLLERAVLSSGLNVSLRPLGSSGPRYWRWRLERRDPRLTDAGPRLVLASGATLAEAREGVSKFTVRFVAPGRYAIAHGGRWLGAGALGTPFEAGGLAITLRAGPDGPPAVGATFTMELTPAAEVAEDVAKELTVTMPKTAMPGEAVKVVTLDYRHTSPRVAAAFVTALMRAYLDSRQGWKTEEATAAESFVTEQSQTIRRELDEAERQLADYKAHSNVVALGDESRGLIDQLGRYEQQRVAARLQVAAFGQIQTVLAKPGANVERYMAGETDDPVLAALSNNLAQARQELRHVEQRFTAEAPATVEQRAQVDNQLKQLKDYVVGRALRAQKQLSSLNEMIGQFEGKLRTVPAAELDLARLTRNTEVLRKMYAFLLERQQQAAVSKASTISRNRILDAAEPPLREDSPALLLRLVLGALIGLFTGVVVVVLRRVLSPAIQSDKQLARIVGDLPVLAAIPRNAAHPEKRREAAAPFSAAPDFAEAFRHLRANLYAKGPTANEVLLVTSPWPGDGKTLCTVSLAAGLAADGKRVLVIEADLHKPSLAARFEVDTHSDLAELLTGQQTWAEAVVPVHTGGARFDLIPSGSARADSAELLSGPGFAAVLRVARAEYDFVLVDSPPFPVVSDALVLARQADRVISVLRLGHTVRRAAERHLDAFAGEAARQAVVVNDTEGETDPAAVAYYHGHVHVGRRRAAARQARASALSAGAR